MIYDRCITSLGQVLTQIVSETGSLTEESTHAERGAFGNISTRRDIPKKLLYYSRCWFVPLRYWRKSALNPTAVVFIHLSIPEVSHTYAYTQRSDVRAKRVQVVSPASPSFLFRAKLCERRTRLRDDLDEMISPKAAISVVCAPGGPNCG